MHVPTEVGGVRFPRELGLQAIVSHLIWVPGIKLGSSERAVCVLNH